MQNPRVLLLVDTSRIAGREMVAGVSKYSHLQGHWVFYTDIPFFGPTVSDDSQFEDLNGLIVHIPDPRIVAKAVSLGLPAIVRGLQGRVPDMPNFISDNQEIGKMAAEHLLAQGLKHFGFCGYTGVDWSQERQDSFCQQIEQAGFAVQSYLPTTRKKARVTHHETESLSDWLQQLPYPVGIFACNDDRGMEVTHACHLAGIRVPDDVAVVGVDNDEIICELANPPLTSIARDFEHAGYRAGELLDRMMQGATVDREDVVTLPTQVIHRQSTDLLAVDDNDVVDAIRFIRNNMTRSLCVEDVLDEVAISRRYLDHKFNAALGHSVHDAITRARIERIARMLLETNRTVSQIAYDLGFSSPDHIGRFFRRHKGINPTEFRRKYK